MRIFYWKSDCFETFPISLMFLLVINSVFIQRVKFETLNLGMQFSMRDWQ